MGPNGGNSGDMQGVGTALAAGGSLIKGIGGYEAGRFNAKVARYNKRVALDEAVATETAVRDEARAAMGEQLASQGAGGLAIGTGSAAEALRQSAVNAQLDALNIRRKAKLAGRNYDIQAWNAKAQGKAAFVNGAMDAATAIFSGGADYAAAGA